MFGGDMKMSFSSHESRLRENSGGDYVEREGIVVKVLPKSICFFDDVAGHEWFVPVSKLADWWFTNRGDKHELRICDLELDDEITILVPRWLLRREGIDND
jgi:hypothetical protein